MEKQYKLPRKFAEQWLADLRSEKYGQIVGRLSNGKNGFCCLGLAVISCGNTVDVLNKVVYKDEESSRILGNSDFVYSSENKITYFDCTQDHIPNYPKELLYGGGILSSLPSILADMNDKGSTFEEIANWIEENCEFYD